MTIRPCINDNLTWIGFFADYERGAAWLLICGVGLLIRWGEQYDFGYMQRSGLLGRRDRLTGEVEIFMGYVWRPVHPVNWSHFRLGSPPLITPPPPMKHEKRCPPPPLPRSMRSITAGSPRMKTTGPSTTSAPGSATAWSGALAALGFAFPPSRPPLPGSLTPKGKTLAEVL